MSDPINDLKQELLAAAERQHRGAAVPAGRRPLRGLLVAATLVLAAVVALVFTSPWSSSPSFVERAEAALTPPAATVLHQKWEMTVTSTDPACTVTRGPNEIWIDQAAPHRYRALLNDLPDPELANADAATLACSEGIASELGGLLNSGETLRFVPPNRIEPMDDLRFMFPLDPVGDLRQWLAAGSAHDEGTVQLDGRTVRRIRIDPPTGDCSPLPACPDEPMYWYADPETYVPVETRGPGYIHLPGRPLGQVQLVMRYLTFENLPRTEANLALTDIRAQHPNATGP
jgi:hypothetical protein